MSKLMIDIDGDSRVTPQDVREFAQQVAGRPPIDIEGIARMVGVRRIDRVNLHAADACLLPNPNGHVILLNNNTSPGRQRFSIAHEIGHVLLRAKCAKFRARRRAGPWSPEEELCNSLAAELLMPMQVFQREADEFPPSLSWIVELSKRYEVAIEGAAWRFSETTSAGVEVFCWEMHANALIPRWISGTEIARSWWATESLIRPLNDLAFGPVRAFNSKRLIVSREQVLDGISPLYFESKRFGRDSRPYVLSIVQGRVGPSKQLVEDSGIQESEVAA